MKKLICVLICLLLAIPCCANPIPIPPPASMPLEDMYVEIQPDGNGLHALFTGDFTFDYIPEDVLSMLFPVPPDANNISVWQDDNELDWSWDSNTYPTILPELPTIPMIEWLGPFPTTGAVFRVDYEHNLIKWPEEFIFFYASGTGKYFETYDKTTTAYFDILLPAGFAVAGVWLDYTPHEYEVVDGHLMITVQSLFGPITNDLIVSLVQTPIYVATDGNDTTGDGSPENPFATIQKGIDTAIDGHTVIVQPGTYTGPGNRDIDFKGKAITVQSFFGPGNCIIDCEGAGRGFYFHSDEDANSTVAGFTITNGYASGDWPENVGGAILCLYASPIIKNCIISGNSAIAGGGIYCKHSYNATITNCVITENTATTSGGGIFCDVGMMLIGYNDVIMTNCTFYANTSTYGGAVSIGEGSNPSIANCILRGDNAPFGPEIAMTTFDWGSQLSIIYTDVQGGQAAIYDIDHLYWGPGNIDTDSLFANPNNDNYHLKSTAGRWDPNSESWVTDANTSPCIDTGNPGCPPGDEPLPNGNRINMGAYGGTAEASKSPANWRSIADLTNDWVVDINDLGVFVNYWLDTGQCIPSDLDRNLFINFNDYAIFANNWLLEH